MRQVLDIESFYRKQLQQWALAEENYTALDNVMLKTVSVHGCKLILQFNPKRIISSSAKVDPASINLRPCFLCTVNRPQEQTGLSCLDEYLVLVNPYPVFHHHFTIISSEHKPQRIKNNFSKLLKIAEMMENYMVIYNGPACGASAPDHFHFQAFPKKLLPLETAWRTLSEQNHRFNGIKVFSSGRYPGKMITLEGKDAQAMKQVFGTIYQLLFEALPAADEPMMNMLAGFRNSEWIVHIVPRRLHRPRQYFEQGEKQFLLSPASIDMGGVLVIPRQDDFNRITQDDIEDIFNQVCVDDFFIDEIISKISQAYG